MKTRLLLIALALGALWGCSEKEIRENYARFSASIEEVPLTETEANGIDWGGAAAPLPASSERLQELDQVVLLPPGQSQPEGGVVVVHDIPEGRETPVVEETTLAVGP